MNIQYIPLCKNDESLEKVLFIVDDITEVEEESNKNKEISIDYEALLEVLPFKDKEKLSKDLSKIIGESVSSLEIMTSPNATDLSVEQIDQILFTLFHNFNKSLCSQLKLPEEEITMTIRELRNVQKYEKNKLLAWSVEKLSNLFLLLMRYFDSLNILHKNNLGPKVTYSLPRGFDKSIQDKREDLDRIMVNLLEYVFLVRKVNDLDKDKMANAPKKARLYAHFDETISLLLNRSRLLAFLLTISGKEDLSTFYFELSELLSKCPIRIN